MTNRQFERTSINRIRVHVMPTDRFKTFAVSVYIGHPLAEDTVTLNALIPFVLRRGSESYPETKQFRERLDDLYGAGFGFDIYKRGDNQIVQFRMDVIDEQFVSEPQSLLKQSFEFIGEALTKPMLEDGRFTAKYVETEKNTLRKKLEAIVNDKIRYAAERCIEEMFRNEPYRLHPLGKIDDIAQITPQVLYERYVEWLATAPIDVYVVGNTTLEEVKSLVHEYFKVQRTNSPAYDMRAIQPSQVKENTIVERLDVNQGKLNMGLRTFITYGDDLYPAALMYNGILGGYPHSKLFINVREKASLAYYASSRLDGHKGILTLQSGIEIENYEKAVTIIKEQLEAMKSGTFSDLELSQTRAMISNQLREIHDSAFEMISFDFNGVLSGKERTAEGLLEAVQQTDEKTIQTVARQVQLDTIYFLRDRKGE